MKLRWHRIGHKKYWNSLKLVIDHSDGWTEIASIHFSKAFRNYSVVAARKKSTKHFSKLSSAKTRAENLAVEFIEEIKAIDISQIETLQIDEVVDFMKDEPMLKAFV